MHKTFVRTALITAIFLPTLALAQENQPTEGSYCPHLTRDLKYGDKDSTTGGQVTELQKFLSGYYDLDPDTYITGYFGRLTKQNVIRFQTEQNLPAFGYVGPLTRAAIARVCGTQATPPLPPPPANQCTPLPPQTQTLSCPTGQTGSIIQTRYSTCPGPTWGPWTTTSNTCTSTTANTQPPTVSLTINGQSTITLPPNQTFTVAWSSSNATSCNLTNAQGGVTAITPNTSSSSQGSAPAAGTTYTYTLSCTNAGGTTTKSATVTGATGGTGGTGNLTATPISGAAPLLVTFTAANAGQAYAYIDYGDGQEGLSHLACPTATTCDPNYRFTETHKYDVPGTYAAKLVTLGATGGTIGTVTISVGPLITSACTYKGQSYAEGQTVDVPAYLAVNGAFTALCDNGVWVWAQPNSAQITGRAICDIGWLIPSTRADFECGTYVPKQFLTITPRHGRAPLTITAKTQPSSMYGWSCPAYTLSWGDGTTENYPLRPCDDTSRFDTRTHTYSSQGSYVVSYQITESTGTFSNSANIRVDAAGTASTQSPNQSQLASALSALESALKAFLKLLGQ